MKKRYFALVSLCVILSTTLVTPLVLHAQEPGSTASFNTPPVTALEDLGVAIRADQPEGAVLAVALPDVYILPDSKLYWMVQLWESFRLILTEDPEERADLLLELSKKRLSETYTLLKKDKVSVATTNIERYKQQLQQALGIVQDLPGSAMQQERYDAFGEQVWYQKALANVIQVEGLSNVFADMTGAFGTVTQQLGSLQLTDIE